MAAAAVSVAGTAASPALKGAPMASNANSELETAFIQSIESSVAREPDGATLTPTLLSIPASSSPALLWHIPASVTHPLRALVGNAPLLLATAVPAKQAPKSGLVSRKKKEVDVNEEDFKVELKAVDAVDLDRSDASARGVGGMVGISPADSGASIGDSVSFQLPLVPATQTPLPMQSVRRLLALYSATGNQNLPTLFCYATLASGEKKFVGLQRAGAEARNGFGEPRMAFVWDVVEQPPVTATFPTLTASTAATIPTPTLEPPLSTSDFIHDFFISTTASDDDDSEPDHPKSEIHVRYNIVSSLSATQSHLSLSLTYTDPKPELLTNPLSEPGAAVLEVGYVPWPTDRDHATGRLWRELKVLEEWSGLASLNGEDEEAVWTGRGPGVADRVDSWIDGLKNEGGSSGSGVEEEFLAVLDEDEEDGTRGETGTLPMRKELEFTERVWCFLLASASKTDLVDALTALIDSLETGALLPPISKSNPTPFGKLIRDCIRLHSLRTAAASQTEALQSHIEGGFDGLLENVWEGVSMLGIWKLGRDARNLLQGVVDNEILDLLLVNPATKIPYGCTPDAVPAVSDEELEALEDQTGYEIKWAVKVLRALWRAYEISRFVSENAIGVPKVSVKGVVEGVLKEVVDEAKERAKAVLLRERGEKVPGWTVGEVKKGGVFRVSLPRVSVATSKFVGHVARSFRPAVWSVTLKQPATGSGSGSVRTLMLTQRRDPEQPEGLFAAPLDAAGDDDADLLLEDTQDLTIAGAGVLRAPRIASSVPFGADSDDEERIVYDALLADSYFV